MELDHDQHKLNQNVHELNHNLLNRKKRQTNDVGSQPKWIQTITNMTWTRIYMN